MRVSLCAPRVQTRAARHPQRRHTYYPGRLQRARSAAALRWRTTCAAPAFACVCVCQRAGVHGRCSPPSLAPKRAEHMMQQLLHCRRRHARGCRVSGAAPMNVCPRCGCAPFACPGLSRLAAAQGAAERAGAQGSCASPAGERHRGTCTRACVVHLAAARRRLASASCHAVSDCRSLVRACSE